MISKVDKYPAVMELTFSINAVQKSFCDDGSVLTLLDYSRLRNATQYMVATNPKWLLSI
jgi:hypothetical protein